MTQNTNLLRISNVNMFVVVSSKNVSEKEFSHQNCPLQIDQTIYPAVFLSLSLSLSFSFSLVSRFFIISTQQHNDFVKMFLPLVLYAKNYILSYTSSILFRKYFSKVELKKQFPKSLLACQDTVPEIHSLLIHFKKNCRLTKT